MHVEPEYLHILVCIQQTQHKNMFNLEKKVVTIKEYCSCWCKWNTKEWENVPKSSVFPSKSDTLIFVYWHIGLLVFHVSSCTLSLASIQRPPSVLRHWALKDWNWQHLHAQRKRMSARGCESSKCFMRNETALDNHSRGFPVIRGLYFMCSLISWSAFNGKICNNVW